MGFVEHKKMIAFFTMFHNSTNQDRNKRYNWSDGFCVIAVELVENYHARLTLLMD
jgi:hypothetical protein